VAFAHWQTKAQIKTSRKNEDARSQRSLIEYVSLVFETGRPDEMKKKAKFGSKLATLKEQI
jgi:hypothetical protein